MHTGRVSVEMVYQTVVDLSNAHRVATRQVLRDMLGVKFSVVDDHVKRLIDSGRLRKVVNGVFEPVDQHPPARPCSLTVLPDGTTKLEVGDDLMTLTPAEARRVGTMLHGDAVLMAHLRQEREDGNAEAHLRGEVSKLRRQLADMRAALQRLQRSSQQPLFQ